MSSSPWPTSEGQASELVSGQIANSPTSRRSVQRGDHHRLPRHRPVPLRGLPAAASAGDVCWALLRTTRSAPFAWNDAGDSSSCGMTRGFGLQHRPHCRPRDLRRRGQPDFAMTSWRRWARLRPGRLDNDDPGGASPRAAGVLCHDVIQTLDFSFPCTQPIPYERSDGDPVCIAGRNGFRPSPR